MLTNLCVLVVGRDGEERELLEIFLRDLGLYVVTVPSAAEAMTALRLVHVDAAIVSSGLTPSSGGPLLGCMRKAGHHFPAIALVASRAHDDVGVARRGGFDAYLVQPVDVDALESTLRRVVAAWAPTPTPVGVGATMHH
jgi:DNA-binding response OmpR family regulator